LPTACPLPRGITEQDFGPGPQQAHLKSRAGPTACSITNLLTAPPEKSFPCETNLHSSNQISDGKSPANRCSLTKTPSSSAVPQPLTPCSAADHVRLLQVSKNPASAGGMAHQVYRASDCPLKGLKGHAQGPLGGPEQYRRVCHLHLRSPATLSF